MGLIALGAAGAIAGGVAAGSKGSGKNVIQRVTKNNALEQFNLGSQADYRTTRDQSALGLDQYIRDYLSGGAAAATRTGEETGAIDRYYNGDVDRALAQLRTRQVQANDTALARALGYATRSQNLDRIAGGGGDSSYNRQLALKTGADMNLNALLQNIAQERADEEYIRQNQLGLAGRRTSMADALAARDLVPGSARKAELGWNIGSIQGLLANDQANNFYGIKYKPSGLERFSNIFSGALGGFIGAGGAGGLGGMMGGGGEKSNPGGDFDLGGSPAIGERGYVTPLSASSGGWGAPAVPWSQMPIAPAAAGGYSVPSVGTPGYSLYGGGWGTTPAYTPAWGSGGW